MKILLAKSSTLGQTEIVKFERSSTTVGDHVGIPSVVLFWKLHDFFPHTGTDSSTIAYPKLTPIRRYLHQHRILPAEY